MFEFIFQELAQFYNFVQKCFIFSEGESNLTVDLYLGIGLQALANETSNTYTKYYLLFTWNSHFIMHPVFYP